MALEHGMIAPFSPEQVRVSDGHKIVSYGTSSYGYDVRCADEFKIFTNINSTIVDPKSFDEKSFVDFKGPVCIIPPNSFALASTVEFFRIPRTVLTVCLGKCVTGDTRARRRRYRRICADHADAVGQAYDGLGRLALETGEGVGLHTAGQARDLRAAHTGGVAYPGDGQSPVSNARPVGALERFAARRSYCGCPRDSRVRKDAHP